jgi:hypothetical protein
MIAANRPIQPLIGWRLGSVIRSSAWIRLNVWTSETIAGTITSAPSVIASSDVPGLSPSSSVLPWALP